VICYAQLYTIYYSALQGIQAWGRFFRDIWRITGKTVITTSIVAGLAKVAYDNRASIEEAIQSFITQ